MSECSTAGSEALKLFLKTFLVAGTIMGVIVHFVTLESMPWWPDTAIMGAAFGALAALSTRQHHRTNRFVWHALKRAVGHSKSVRPDGLRR